MKVLYSPEKAALRGKSFIYEDWAQRLDINLSTPFLVIGVDNDYRWMCRVDNHKERFPHISEFSLGRDVFEEVCENFKIEDFL